MRRLIQLAPSRPLVLAAALAIPYACGFPRPTGSGGGDGDGGGSAMRVDVVRMPITQDRDVDLLFVVSTRAGTDTTQSELGAAIPALVQQLSADDNGLPNLHIGVITTDMGTSDSAGAVASMIGACTGSGDNGRLEVGSASTTITGRFVSDIATATPGQRQTNYTGALATVLATIITQGTAGCDFEQPFAAVRAALTGGGAAGNAGFIRPAASLGVIVVGDHDDCSAQSTTLFTPGGSLGALDTFRCFSQGVVCAPDAPATVGSKTGCAPRDDSAVVVTTASFATYLLAQKPDPRRLMFSSMTGPSDPVQVVANGSSFALSPSCQYTDNVGVGAAAFPSTRLAAIAAQLPSARTATTSICDASLVDPVVQVAVAARQLIGDPCIEVPLSATPDCELDIVSDAAPSTPIVLPACQGGTQTECWDLFDDATHCPNQAHHRLRLDTTRVFATDAWIYLRCLL